MDELKKYEDKMNKTLEVLKEDFGTIRAGRANPHVLDKIKVDYYGSPTPIPVSYTHLDVYKRQGWAFPSRHAAHVPRSLFRRRS